MRVSRQWRHLQDLKRFGYGHDKDKVPGDGDLADFCPACPQPGVNLPDEWHNLPDRFANIPVNENVSNLNVELCIVVKL
jgi:hypothetical protein